MSEILVQKHLKSTFAEQEFHQGVDVQLLASSWASVIRSYSSGNLTYPSDKLVAISGIANEMTRKKIAKPEDYVCGFWRSCLLEHLLWYVQLGNIKAKTEFHEPSWSWVSVDGEVGFSEGDSGSRKYLVELMDVKVETICQDPFGQVKDGCIRLRCNLKKITKISGAGRLESFYGRGMLRNILERLKNWSPTIAFRDSAGDYRLHSRFTWHTVRDYISSVSDVDEGSELYFLPVSEDGRKRSVCIEGLLLAPTKAVKGQFRRIGSMSIFSRSRPRAWYLSQGDTQSYWLARRRGRKSLSVRADKEDELECESFDGSNYTITII